MSRMGRAILVLALATSVGPANDERQAKRATPAEQYKALVKEYRDAEKAFERAFATAKTDDEKRQLLAEKNPLQKFPSRFLELAEKNPKESVAVDALIWVMKNAFHVADGPDSPRAKATALLLRDHARSDRLGEICERMTLTLYKDSEVFLRTLLEVNPHKKVKALASLTLAQFLHNGLRTLDIIKDGPDFWRADWRNNLFLEDLRKRDRAKVIEEVEALLEQAAERYGDVKASSFAGTIGEKAKSELFEIRHLSIGKEVPQIEGEDQDGKKLKLSDYRGKVVLLDFWREL